MAKQVRIIKRKRPACGPVDVPALWKRLEKCLKQQASGLAGNLAPGAKAEDIKALQTKIGQPLPEEVRQSFLAHDGQRWSGDGEARPIFHGLSFISVEQSLEQWELWRQFDDDHDLQAPDLKSSKPRNAIALRYCNPDWIPLADIDQLIGYVGVDLGPGPKGFPGQVINFGRNEDDKHVSAWSWGWFLNDLVAEMEQGNCRMSEDEDGSPLGLGLDTSTWNYDHFGNNGKSDWHKAKNGGRRPFNPHADLSGLRTTTVLKLARSLKKDAAFDDLPILGDALEEAGCADAEILRHCREPGEHGTSCWLIDLLLEEAKQAAPRKRK